MKVAVVTNESVNEISSSMIDLTRIIPDEWDIHYFSCPKDNNIFSQLLSYCPDIIISLNLAGFHMTTLTGGLAYNLIHAKQIHIVNTSLTSADDLSTLSNPLSLSMHFLCISESDKDRVLGINSDIPFIEVLHDPVQNITQLINLLTEPQS